MNFLQNKIIVLTGGLGLLGRSFTKYLINEGAYVVVLDKNPPEVDHYITSLQIKDNQCTFLRADITSEKDIKDCIAFVHKKYKKIDGLVNNAYPRNSAYGADFWEVDYDSFCENISMNIGGYFICCKEFARYFSNQGCGSIVNIASIYGTLAPRFEIYENMPMTMPVEYAAIKAAIIQLTKYMAKYLKGKNIRVNSLSPGGIIDKHDYQFLTNYKKHTLNKGMLDPIDICGSLAFLLSDQALYINGQNIIVDDGFSL